MKMAKAIIYTRVSTDEQVDGNSLEFQAKRLEDLCKSENISILKIFVEPGVSAKNVKNRPELLEALKLARRQLAPGDFFITYDISRFTRNHYEGVGMMMELQNKGVFFRDATRTYTDSPEDRFMFILNSGLAQLDNEVKARATRERMSSLAKGGEWLHQPPFGYRKGDKKSGENCLVPLPEEAELVRQIFSWIGSGDSIVDIAGRLDTFDVFTCRMGPAKGNRNIKFVKRVLTSLVYSGRQNTKLTGGVVVNGHWEAIVSREQFDSVQPLVESEPRVRTLSADPFWLKQVLCCGLCGNKFTGLMPKGNRYQYYRCFGCKKESLPMGEAHKQFIEILELLMMPEYVAMEIKEALKTAAGDSNKSLQYQKQELEREIDKKRQKLEMLQDEILMPTNPGLDRESLNERAARLQEEMSTKKTALAEVLESEGLDIDLALQVMEEVLEHLPSIFNHLQDDEKASFAFVLLPEKVICKDKKLQTPHSLVAASVSGTFGTPSPTWHP